MSNGDQQPMKVGKSKLEHSLARNNEFIRTVIVVMRGSFTGGGRRKSLFADIQNPKHCQTGERFAAIADTCVRVSQCRRVDTCLEANKGKAAFRAVRAIVSHSKRELHVLISCHPRGSSFHPPILLYTGAWTDQPCSFNHQGNVGPTPRQ